MPGPRQPIELVIANGKKHLTKAEIEERINGEVKPLEGELLAPSYLTKKQKAEFNKIAEQLERLKIIGETDIDALARYIIAQDLYINAVKKLRSKEVRNDPELTETWIRVQEKFFKQARASASDLGLTISSRCKLVVPAANTPEKPANKFAKFEKSVNE